MLSVPMLGVERDSLLIEQGGGHVLQILLGCRPLMLLSILVTSIVCFPEVIMREERAGPRSRGWRGSSVPSVLGECVGVMESVLCLELAPLVGDDTFVSSSGHALPLNSEVAWGCSIIGTSWVCSVT